MEKLPIQPTNVITQSQQEQWLKAISGLIESSDAFTALLVKEKIKSAACASADKNQQLPCQ